MAPWSIGLCLAERPHISSHSIECFTNKLGMGGGDLSHAPCRYRAHGGSWISDIELLLRGGEIFEMQEARKVIQQNRGLNTQGEKRAGAMTGPCCWQKQKV
ncbi:Uncharacterized protein HZ326_18520 [Fusarium oxysporum f. sp. albedinis]|nr:Uncharacterized protein HZ326_18520 [Fusarium oxysporum f. sp. albedinis]